MSNSVENVDDFVISQEILQPEQRKLPPKFTDVIPFGRVPTDHIFICDYVKSKGGWVKPRIVPNQAFALNPTCMVFHYGQEIFEGLKAYLPQNQQGNSFYLFRPELNAQRMYNSALRLGMEPFPVSYFCKAVEEIVKVDKNWILPYPGSLYIRPTLIALDDGVSVRASEDYRFFICLSPAKSYYSSETSIAVYVEREMVRAVKGGTGEAKCGGNYAAAIPALQKAKRMGAEQVLWLDAIDHRYVEEVGAMNLMFVYGNKIITPKLSGSILRGITRSSILEIAASLGYSISEEKIDIDTVFADIENGSLTEVFGSGTAAVISPVHMLIDGDKNYVINAKKIGPVSMHLKSTLMGIQFGTLEGPAGWRKTISY